MKYRFFAPWDWIVSLVTVLLLSFFGGLLFFTEQNLIPQIMYICIILICALFGVYGYTIQNESIHIIRLGWKKRIKITDIKKVEFIPNAMKKSIRTWGIGGAFGYIGYFNNRILGKYKAFATNRKNTVILYLNSKENLYVLTPDKPEAFIECLKKQMPNCICE